MNFQSPVQRIMTSWYFCIAMLIFIALAIVANMALFLAFHTEEPFFFGDSKSYWYTAGHLIENHFFKERFNTGTTPSSWRPPMNALFLCVLRWVGFTPMMIAVFQNLLHVGIIMLLYSTVRLLDLKRGFALCLCCIYAVYPHSWVLAQNLMSETLFTFQMMLLVFLCVRVGTRCRGKASLLIHLYPIGALLGLGMLTRNVGVCFFPAVFLLTPAYATRILPAQKKILTLALVWLVLLTGLATPLTPWVARNFAVHGQFLLVNTAGAYNVYIGNVHDTSYLRDPDARAWKSNLTKENSEIEVSKILMATAIDHIRATPIESAQRYLRNFAAFWLQTAPPKYLNCYHDHRLKLLMKRLAVVLQLVAVAVCVCALTRPTYEKCAFMLTVLGVMVVHSITFIDWRFCIPIFPILLIVIALFWRDFGSPSPGDTDAQLP